MKTPTATERSTTSPAIAQTTSEKPITPAVNDLYEHFLAEQKEREHAWKTPLSSEKGQTRQSEELDDNGETNSRDIRC